MSSHREAPQISKDQVADSTDVYAFRSPDKPNMVTLIANYIPFELPDGGPNFYEFGDDVTYDINIDNTGDGYPNIVYRFNFTTVNTIPESFLYNDGPITSLRGAGAALWNRRQSYTLERLDYVDGNHKTAKKTTALGKFDSPPCNIGPLSTPDYPKLAHDAVAGFNKDGFSGTVFAGQRADGFFVDVGSIFDLGILRPFENLHTTFGLKNTGLGHLTSAVNSLGKSNVHSLALQVPIREVTSTGKEPADVTAKGASIGVWTSASRQQTRIYEGTANNGRYLHEGGLVQVSRLGNPLVNEVLIPIGMKDEWNASLPSGDSKFAANFKAPLLADLLPVLYPGVFPHLAKYNANKKKVDRADIEAILLTGLPPGIIKGFNNYLPKGVVADMLRLNLGIKPAAKPNAFGILGGDLAGFPNGRRVWDDVTSIELRALAGATLPLVDPKYKADAAAGELTQGLVNKTGTAVTTEERYMHSFPYLGVPWGGYSIGATSLVNT